MKYIAAAIVSLVLVPFTSCLAFTITAGAGTGASISPSGSVSVSSGASQSFSIGSSSGYQVSGVSVDGSSIGTPGSYTFTDVLADHTINVSASLIPPTGGSEMPYCSGPMAPGWQAGVAGGGCGGKGVQIASGTTQTVNGVSYTCPFWFGSEGCMVGE